MFKCTEGNGLALFGLDQEQYWLRASLRSPAHLSPPTFLHIMSLVLRQSIHPAAHHLPTCPTTVFHAKPSVCLETSSPDEKPQDAHVLFYCLKYVWVFSQSINTINIGLWFNLPSFRHPGSKVCLGTPGFDNRNFITEAVVCRSEEGPATSVTS